jgi:type VI protein secretion system component Hcp
MPPITPTPAGSGHSKDVKITSFSWGVSNSASVGSVSTGGSGGKVSFNPFSIVKQVDRSSPLFFHLAASGQHAQSATLYVLPPGGKSSADEMLEFQLGQPRVSSAVDASTPHGSNETIGLVYSTLTETYLQKGKVEATNVYQISG